MFLRMFFIHAFVFFLPWAVLGQAESTAMVFWEVIDGDSVKLFMNNKCEFVQAECAENIRYTRITADGKFDGVFQDVTIKGLKIGHGRYADGKKHGDFEMYHENGVVSIKGAYRSDLPVGNWEYFYPDGKRERLLKFTGLDTLLMEFVDEKGVVKVRDGEGTFNGKVVIAAPFKFRVAKGKVSRGRPVGTWETEPLMGEWYEEEFKNGHFVQGKIHYASRVDKYRPSLLSRLHLALYFNVAEYFRVVPCPKRVAELDTMVVNAQRRERKEVAAASGPRYLFDVQRFYSDLRERLDDVIAEEVSKRKEDDIRMGDYDLTVRFQVGSSGKPEDIKLLTGSWGYPHFNAIRSVLTNRAKFPPSMGTMYFHLRLSFPGGTRFSYKLGFSNNVANEL